MTISVIQPGARLHYAVPTIFAGAGLLKALYTDLHAEHGILRLADRAIPAPVKPRVIRRLLGRRLPADLPKILVKDRPLQTLACALSARIGFSAARANVSVQLLSDLERSNLGPGDIVYTALINEDLSTMRRLKARGVKIVHECFISPDVGLLLGGEYCRYGLTSGGPDVVEVEEGRRRDVEKYMLSDLVLVPSPFTGRAVRALAPERTRIVQVPYGFDLTPFSRPAAPEQGRILCVGSVGLLKGHPDLAAASRILRAASTSYRVRVVGPRSKDILDEAMMDGPQYVGQVPRSEIVREFAKADLFAFPTICDSFGIVVVEALAMGVPVVCTPNCGDIVRDGVEGFVVPPRDPAALAERIRTIVEDRDLRERMSRNARERAAEFSLEAYAIRLLAAMRSVSLLPPAAA